MPWPKGKPRGPTKGAGRKKGVPNKTTADVREAIKQAFDKAGGVNYLVKLAKDDPKTFVPLLSKIVPAEIKAEHQGAIEIVVSYVDKD